MQNSKLYVFIGIILTISLPISFLVLGGQYSRWRYQKLIRDPQLVEVFTSNNKNAIDKYVSQKQLAYQVIDEGDIRYSSKPNLPRYRIAFIKSELSQGVIKSNLQDLLRQQIPYTVVIEGNLYIMFPLLPDEPAPKGYLIYSKIL